MTPSEPSPVERAAWLRDLRRENAEQEAALAGVFDEQWGETGETHRAFVERFCSMLPAGGRVLDAACGTGKYFGMVLERGLEVLGVDHTHLTDWRQYRDLDYERIYAAMQRPAFVFDGRNLLDAERLHAIGFNVYSIGRPDHTRL